MAPSEILLCKLLSVEEEEVPTSLTQTVTDLKGILKPLILRNILYLGTVQNERASLHICTSCPVGSLQHTTVQLSDCCEPNSAHMHCGSLKIFQLR